MRLGKLRHLITIQEKTITLDDFGQPVKGDSAWSDIAVNPTWYAAIYPTKEDEKPHDSGAKIIATHKIVMRYRTDVTTAHRLIHGTTVYHIHSVIDPFDRDAQLTILASVEEGETYSP